MLFKMLFEKRGANPNARIEFNAAGRLLKKPDETGRRAPQSLNIRAFSRRIISKGRESVE
jgi:hypothetical protein